ncbi:hypothetical protein [Aliamphritea spongicola]|uniref:hypothetical protein n=1 Tax=Aliamphritea spongicola TaxID=707589 RepID=UPI00196B8D3C|nr:hypothetical protein [Aliamphritea spongicola]MBN3561031.1 hypothetical protein [Aliamphritea spongicola]
MNKAIFVLLLLATLVIHSLPTDNPLSRTLNSITLYSPLPTALTETSIANLNCFSEIKRLITASEISHEIWYSGSNPELVSNSRSINNQGVAINSIKTVTIKARRISLLFLDSNLTTYQITFHNGMVQNISHNTVWMPFFYSDLLI